jgi:ABC-2 type transport system permease protein
MALSEEAGVMKRILQIVRKEFIQIRRDSGLVRMVVLAPLLQLLIYGYVVATDIRALPMAVLDQSDSAESRRLVDRFIFSGYFALEEHVSSLKAAEDQLNSGESMIVLVIPEDYARDIRRGVKAQVQLLVDGTNSNTATIAMGYAAGIIGTANQQQIQDNIHEKGLRMIEAGIREEPRVWFNPSLRAINYMVPGIICVLLMEMMVPLTAFSLVRERERGTVEQLMVTPLRAGEVLIGKTIPYIAIGLADAALILTAGTLWFGVPLPAKLGALLACTLLFIVVALSLGILVATVVKTQQQAALSAQFALVPNILLSGFMFPIESMPEPMQWFTTILPMRYFLVAVRGIMMKGLGVVDLWDQIVPLAVLGAAIFAISWLRFRRVFG